MSGTVEYELFEESMLDACTDLFLEVFTREPWNDEWESKDHARQYILNHCRMNTFYGFVALLDKKVVGVSIGFLKPWQEGYEYYINEFYVDTSLQNRGIGSGLLRFIKEYLAEKSTATAIMLATEKNFPAFRFYIKNGFKALDDLRFLAMDV